MNTTSGTLLKKLMAGLPCLALLLLSAPIYSQDKSSQESFNPYYDSHTRWKMSCFDFELAKIGVLTDESLDRQSQLNLINFFLSKVEKECSHIQLN